MAKSQADYVFFLAHAGPDLEAAKELRNLLVPKVTVFLDHYDLLPGDRWNIELAKHQARSLATVVLLSRHTDPAYYLQEEIAKAIALERQNPGEHRLIPVYLDGAPTDSKAIPYGLQVRHSLDAAKLGMKGVAAALEQSIQGLVDKGPAAEPPNLPPPADRLALYDAMCRLNDSMFAELTFRMNPPRAHMAPETMTLARRALDLVQWTEEQGPAKMQSLTEAIRRMAPGALR